MNMDSGPEAQAQVIVCRYEELRGQALGDVMATRGLGWAFFLRHGMGEWMRIVAKVVRSAPRRELERDANCFTDGGGALPISAIPGREIALLLANMAVAHLNGAAEALNPHCEQEAYHATSQ